MNPVKVDLKDKVVVITGAGGVLCSKMAAAMAETGAKVALLDLHEEKAEKVAAELNSGGMTARGYGGNVLVKEEMEKAHERVVSDLGTCDILINGAGGNNPKGNTQDEFFKKEHMGELKTFFDIEPEGVEGVLRLNFMGTWVPTQVFAKDMIGKKGCSIINISSMNAFTPLTTIPGYSGAKAAVSNFTQWLAVYFAKEGIRCNAIAPGFFVTNQNRAMLFDTEGRPTARTEKILRSTPMERFGEAEELIGTLLYLADETISGFVDGVVIPVDGGFQAYSGV